MTDNRNTSLGLCGDNRGTVCIDTNRVLDSCRDRDCFENSRIYLSAFGEEILSSATNIRAKNASIVGAHVGVDEVPFNCGFYRVTARYYVLVELEACLGGGRSQCFNGITTLEKDVILYGGEGSVRSFSSDPESGYCSVGTLSNCTSNLPVAIVETVEPIVLGSKVECGCQCNCACNEYIDIPEELMNCLDGAISTNQNAPRLYISFGIFSVIRIVRPAQLLVQATDYCVPDKECVAATNDEDPCSIFNNLPFPTSRFCGTMQRVSSEGDRGRGRGGCCGK